MFIVFDVCLCEKGPFLTSWPERGIFLVGWLCGQGNMDTIMPCFGKELGLNRMEEDKTLDHLINQLEQAVDDMGIADFVSDATHPPRECAYTLEKNAYVGLALQRPLRGLVFSIQDGVCTMHVQEALVRGQKMDIAIHMLRDGRGDTRLTGRGVVTKATKVSGRYQIELALDDLGREVEPIHRVFMEYAHHADFAKWNGWCAELKEGAALRGLMLSGTRLAYFDLCCADLSGSNLCHVNLTEANLAGANLAGCNLSGATFDGADLFGAIIPRKFMGILHQAGLIELESVTFTND